MLSHGFSFQFLDNSATKEAIRGIEESRGCPLYINFRPLVKVNTSRSFQSPTTRRRSRRPRAPAHHRRGHGGRERQPRQRRQQEAVLLLVSGRGGGGGAGEEQEQEPRDPADVRHRGRRQDPQRRLGESGEGGSRVPRVPRIAIPGIPAAAADGGGGEQVKQEEEDAVADGGEHRVQHGDSAAAGRLLRRVGLERHVLAAVSGDDVEGEQQGQGQQERHPAAPHPQPAGVDAGRQDCRSAAAAASTAAATPAATTATVAASATAAATSSPRSRSAYPAGSGPAAAAARHAAGQHHQRPHPDADPPRRQHRADSHHGQLASGVGASAANAAPGGDVGGEPAADPEEEEEEACHPRSRPCTRAATAAAVAVQAANDADPRVPDHDGASGRGRGTDHRLYQPATAATTAARVAAAAVAAASAFLQFCPDSGDRGGPAAAGAGRADDPTRQRGARRHHPAAGRAEPDAGRHARPDSERHAGGLELGLPAGRADAADGRDPGRAADHPGRPVHPGRSGRAVYPGAGGGRRGNLLHDSPGPGPSRQPKSTSAAASHRDLFASAAFGANIFSVSGVAN